MTGFLRLKRALPAPGGAYLIAKMVMGYGVRDGGR